MRILIFILLLLASILTHVHGQIIWDDEIEVAPKNQGYTHPRIVHNADGEALIIWGKSKNLMFSKWDGNKFSTPIMLNPDSIGIANASWMGPNIAAHGDTIYVVYKEVPESSISSHIWCRRSFDGGISFGDPVRVDDIGNNLSRFSTVTTDNLGNPIIAFMKFTPAFTHSHWVVSKSIDQGQSFLLDVKASGLDGPESEACDCCPGAISSHNDHVAMLYRNNDKNIRDTWAGLSTDGADSFEKGMNVDQQNWELFSCPASGPDGVIIGDTLYSTYMNGATGTSLVYFNKSSIQDLTSPRGKLLTNKIEGLREQNYPRLDNDNRAMAIVWKQNIDGPSQLAFNFSDDISKGFNNPYEILALKNVINADVALTNDKIFVVWQDGRSRTVKFRSGSYSNTTSASASASDSKKWSVHSNPTSSTWKITGSSTLAPIQFHIYNIHGSIIQSGTVPRSNNKLSLDIGHANLDAGIYLLTLSSADQYDKIKLIKNK